MKKLIAFLMMTSLLGVFVVSAQESAEPRTQYELLNLSTPEAAVTTFIDLFQSRDYAGAFLVFAPEAQDAFYRAINLLALERAVVVLSQEEIADAYRDLLGFDHTETEQSTSNAPYLFDAFMLYAEQNDAFLVDLRGEFEILGTEDSTVPARRIAEESDDDDDAPLPAVDVIVSTEQHGEVRFRMVQVPSGRWRIYQVIVPGGDEEWLPWAVKSDETEG